MNKLFFVTAFLGVCALTHAQQSSGFQISGHLDGIENDTLIVYVQAENFLRTERADTIVMNKGDFAFNLKEKNLRSVVILGKPLPGKKPFEDGKYIDFMMIPGEYVVLNGTLDSYTLQGSPFYTQYNAHQKKTESISRKMKELRKEVEMRLKTEENKDSINAYYQKEYEVMSGQMSQTVFEFIKTNPDSDFSAYLAPSLGERMDEGLALLTERARTGVMSPYIQAVASMKKAQEVRKKAADKLHPGVEAPDFTLNDMNGNPLTLSSLRGKYVVLDYWGSWCVWCIKGFPAMKESYAKHKEKVEFLGIDCNDTEQKWKDAVAKHELPWLHVRNAGEPDVSALYAIQGYPTKIVIDPQGKIARVVVGEDPSFYAYLDELFK